MPLRLTLLLLPLLLSLNAVAAVTSETILFLQEDGRSYLLQRSLRSDARAVRFLVDKSLDQRQLRHVSPNEYRWDDSAREDANSLTFTGGDYTVIVPGQLRDSELRRNAEGEFEYRSWDGSKDAQGRFGYWYSPDDFSDFSYTWIFPQGYSVSGYDSNREGTWVKRANSVSFHARKVNNLTFSIRFRKTETELAPRPAPCPEAACPKQECPQPDCPKTVCPACAKTICPACNCPPVSCPEPHCPPMVQPRCPDPRAAVGIAAGNPASDNNDNDGDSIPDPLDLCPDTRRGAIVDRAGCALDTDKDGVPDGIDRCLATPEGLAVDGQGCRK